MAGSRTLTAGGAIFPRLRALGVEFVFANSGTDFPPIIEGLAQAGEQGLDLPQAIPVAHEHVAMGMAHGAWAVTGKPQVVMLHTNVGLANGVIGAINAAHDHVPLILMSGRTPATERDRFGARTVPIGWGQEMRDQAAMLRECLKWDYELRFPEQVEDILDRAFAIAGSTPQGPVYLSLPREVLCEAVPAALVEGPPRMVAARAAPDPAAIAQAADLLAGAENPVVIAQRGVGAAFDAFAAFVDRHALPVCTWWATRLAIDTDHACHVGSDPGPWVAAADVILVIDGLAPWWPDHHPPNPAAKVIHMGPNPLFSRIPVRNFRADVAIAGETGDCVAALIAAMAGRPAAASVLEPRRARIAAAADELRDRLTAACAPRADGLLSKPHVARVLSDALEGRDTAVFSELGATLGQVRRRGAGSWFLEPHSGGLGWSLPAGLGAALAMPHCLPVVTLGDGSYLFANPAACHQVAQALGLAPLVVVLNNAEWGAVRRSVSGLYPDGAAARANRMPLTGLAPSPEFSAYARASGGWGRRVDTVGELAGAIADALQVIDRDRRLALLDVRVAPD